MNPKNFIISYGMDDSIKTTQLGYHAFHGRITLIQNAIDAKIDWTAEDVEAIHGAILGSQKECFEILLAAESPINSYTHYLLHRILPDLYRKHFLNLRYRASLDKATATSNLVDASQRAEIDLCQHFLNAGADPNDNKYGILPIVSAVTRLNKNLISLLLDHGAQINNMGRGKHSPLRHMVSSGSHLDKAARKEIYEYLISRGAIAEPPFSEKETISAEQGLYVSLP